MENIKRSSLERILSKHINTDRVAAIGHECTDAEYYQKWKRMYRDTSNYILNAMEEAIEEAQSNYIKR